MTLVAAGPFLYPNIMELGPGFALNTGMVIDATGEMAAMIGRVWFPAGSGSKDITKVWFRFGAVTKAGGSGLTVSLQNVSTTTGPPFQPDGTQDQTVAIANGNASFAANTYIQTAAFSANRTVAFGEMVAVVIEYDGSGRLGADSVIISSTTPTNALNLATTGGTALKTGGTWAINNAQANILLEFSDGTFGTFDSGAMPLSALTNASINNSGGNEYALRFSFPFDCKINGMFASGAITTNAEFDFRLLEGTTVLETISFDYNQFSADSATRYFYAPIAERTLTKNTVYYASIKPTTANNITLPNFDVSANAHMQALGGGVECYYATRAAGAWTETTTKRPLIAVRISAINDSAGAIGSSGVIGG